MCNVEGCIYEGGVVLCPECLGHDVAKGGLLLGRQRYSCKAAGCGRVFVARSPRQVVDDLFRQAARATALKLVAAGVSVAVIAEATGIPVRTIYHDIKLAAGQGR